MSKGMNALDLMVTHLIPKYAMSQQSLEDFRAIRKELEALNLIIDKNVDIGLLKITTTIETYNREIKKILFGYDDGKLTKEEYDFLKEVL